MIGEDKLIHFSGVEMGQACTIVLRGASFHVLDEAERSLCDALSVLVQTVQDSRVILGGGWPEMLMEKQVDELARRTLGKKSLAIDSFAHALRAIPTIIANNAGLDSVDLVAQLHADHQENDNSYTGKLRSSSVNANTKWQSILILDPIIQAENQNKSIQLISPRYIFF